MQCSAQVFRSVLSSVAFAADEDNRHFCLASVRIESKGNKAVAVATDGKRLASREFKVDANGDDTLMIPVKSARELIDRINPNTAQGDIVIGEGDNRHEWAASWMGNRKTRVVKFGPIEGRFPSWRDIANQHPKTSKLTSTVFNLLQQMPDENQDAWLFDGASFRKRPVELSDVQFEGDKLEVLFDVTYLRDWLQSLPDPQAKVTIQFSGDDGPVVCRCPGRAAMYVFMPMGQD